jgi:stage II sporulation protein D
MKRIFAVSIIMLLLSAALPGLLMRAPSLAAQPAETGGDVFRPQADAKKEITVLTGDKTAAMTMHDYLIGVLSAEMPAKFAPEALKAQAVAARTYAMYGILTGKKHENADVCTDPECCQAYHTDAELRKNWGSDYAANLKKITAAVEATDGQYLVSGGEPILAAFHSSSGGQTENSADAWKSGKPYLVSVSSPETEKDVPNFVSTVSSSPIDFRDTVLSKHPEADFTGKTETWLGATKTDGGGRVTAVKVGGVEVTGAELRTLFGLRSTEFTLGFDGMNFVFTVTGYGHGVGMSQYGANVMAAEGRTFADILSHYYPGTQLVKSS